MKQIKTEDAVGQMLCHDITQIIKDVSKGPIFRKGHIITEEDVPVLLSVGKDHVYIWENNENMMHENDAAEILCDVCRGENVGRGEVKEGKIELYAECSGVLKIDNERLYQVNSAGQMMIASIHGNFPVKKGDKLGGTRIIPLLIEKEKMERVREIADGRHIFNVRPFLPQKAGIVTTGNEVFYGRIQDTFTPVVERKLKEYNVDVMGKTMCDDSAEHIVSAIKGMLSHGADMIICTGGMSVDPDDRTPLAIRKVTDRVVTYGAPVLPGAMFMLAYAGNVPVMGLPGCVMYAGRTIFDLVLPRLLTGEKLEKQDFDCLGQGGFCLGCNVCTFPNCGFGKGIGII